MKKHLAIICGIYYPNPSATGQCAKRFAELLSDQYEIDVICMSQDASTAEVETENGVRLHLLNGKRLSLEVKSRGVAKKILHLLGGVQIKMLLLGNLSWYRTAASQKLEEINSEKKLDAVFSICSPFAAHFAAMDYKQTHPQVRWCGYTVDPYATRNRIRPIWCNYERLIKEERNILRKMDAVLLSEEVHKNRPELYEGCKDCKELPYMLPAFQAASNERKFFDEKDINCVYAGSFYQDIRNPECMLQLFSHLSDPKIKLHLFSTGCEGMVKKYAESCSNIVCQPRVPVSEIAQVYHDADVLVNIGNAIEEFMPSKTFEYIATGKPIINFYYAEADKDILGRYPNCLQIQNSLLNIDDDGLLEFISGHSKNRVKESVINIIYNKHSAEHIRTLLCNAFGYN